MIHNLWIVCKPPEIIEATTLLLHLDCSPAAHLRMIHNLYDLWRLANDPEVVDHAEVKAEEEKARAARAAALPKLVAAAEKAQADAKKLQSLALEADVAYEDGHMELKK